MLSPSGCKACQLILWQMGDARFGATPPKHADAIQFCPSLVRTSPSR